MPHRQATTQRLDGAGLELVVDSYGLAANPPVILLHGGGQTRHSWRNAGRELARSGWYVLSMDQRGHGESDWVEDGNYQYDQFVDDLRSLIRSLDQPPVLVGASLGGIVGLLSQDQAEHPLLRALVLVDIVPQIKRGGERRIRDFMAGHPEGFATLEEAAQAVAEYLPERRRPDSREGLRKNLRQHADGRYYWHWDKRMMAAFARAGAGALEARMQAAAGRLQIPTLLIRGELSDVVSPEGAADFLRTVPHAEFTEVAGAGHMVAGDDNDRFVGAVKQFLTKL
ncbi:MAG: alpha/beta hydrolase [Gammaproteobacteria bacterium]